MDVGFIGLGRLGSVLVGGLLEGSVESLRVYDVDPSAMERWVGSGASPATSIAEIARSADVVGICVQDDDRLRDVVSSPTGLLAAPMRPGAIIVVHSTVRPETCRELADEAASVGVSLIDAAISICRAQGPE